MANRDTTVVQPAPPKTPQRSFLKCLALILLSLIVLVGLAVLIAWLVIHPKHLVFTVEDAYVKNYNLSHDHLNATFELAVRAVNPNRRVVIYYEDMQVTVEYEGVDLANDTVQPFVQPRKNATMLNLQPQARELALLRHVSRNLRIERSAGSVEVDVRLQARVRFKVGIWKSRHRTLKIHCDRVVARFVRPKSFDKIYCRCTVHA